MQAHLRGHRRLVAIVLPWLLGAAVVGGLYWPLLSPDRTLATRDVATFHLPLRVDLARLAQAGDLSWNPYLHGGQPLVSNPSYATYYPFTWLVAVLPADTALDLSVFLHALLGFAGAWWLARRLGCGRGGAAIAAVGYAAGGGVLSLLHALNLFTGMAWFPWILAAADAAFSAPPGRWLRPTALTGLLLGLALLNGEPVTVSIAGLGVLALAAGRWIEGLREAAGGAGRKAFRLAAPLVVRGGVCLLLALALAGAQIVPTLARLSDSPRGSALAAEASAAWSAPPQRVAELVWPRFFGDPMRLEENLWFGRRLHDRDFPYIPSLYPGLLITLLAAVALVRRSTPRRWAWWLAIGLGGLLALGRYNPVFGLLLDAVPWLDRLRYPEKYALLAVGVLPFVAALGWESLLAERQEGRRGRLDLPLVLAGLVVAASVTLGLGLWLWPDLRLVLTGGAGEAAANPAVVEAGGRLLTAEAFTAALMAAAVVGWLLLLRWRRVSAAVLAAAAVMLLAADLGRVGHGMVRTIPAEEYRRPPPLIASSNQVLAGRLFSDQGFSTGGELLLRGDDPQLATVRTALRRLDPYAPNLWGVSLALHEDYDLMLTSWARHALAALRHDYRDPYLTLSQLSAWDVKHLALRRPPKDLAERLARGEAVEPAELRRNAGALPRFRFVEQIAFHPDATEALAAARADRFRLRFRDFWVDAAATAGTSPPPRSGGRVLDREEVGGRMRIEFEAPDGGYLVAAVTFDPGWSGSVDGVPVALFPTALGQIGTTLPPGAGTLVLRYRDPWVARGVAVTLLTGLALAGTALVRRLRRRR